MEKTEAMKILKDFHDKSALFSVRTALDTIIPELKESEDERIRDEIMTALVVNVADNDSAIYSGAHYSVNECIAWLEKRGETFTKKDVDDAYLKGVCNAKQELEKQGEQKPVVIPKFRVGDIIKDTEDGEVFTIRTITKDKYIYTDDSFDWIKDQDEYELVEQKPTDEEMKELLHTEYEKGMADAREQMMAKAFDVEVKVDAGGYPYIPQIELYDYDKDMPLAKKGDKYKVVLIKED